MIAASILLLAALPQVFSAPLWRRDATPSAQLPPSNTSTTSVSLTDIDAILNRPAQFARAAYCQTGQVQNWTCGAPCNAIQGVQILQIGGNEAQVPFYFIAHDPTDNSVVVSHEGTDPHKLLSIANDAAFGLVAANQSHFPGAPATALVHQGFQETFQRTADDVLSGVQAALKSTGATKVAVAGHSLGAAIATMDTMMLSLNLPEDITITAATFGLPRTGNQDWANFVDSTVGGNGNTAVFAHVSNQHDPVPIVPPRFLGFQQVSGEIHIQDVDGAGQATTVVNCPGQDNDNCAEGNDILDADVSNHLGPYFNDLSFGAKQCV